MTRKSAKSILDERIQLFEKLIPENLADVSEEEIGKLIIDYVLQQERLRHGYQADDIEGTAHIDRMTLKKMQTWDTDEPELSTIEKVFRRYAEGRNEDATALLINKINQRASQISSDQKQRRSRPNRQNPAAVLIEKIVMENPKISWKGVWKRLKNEVGQGVIDDVTDTLIVPTDRKFPAIKVSGLSNRITNIRKKIKASKS